jgi:GAF domain-containing protein/HAMP domain-containing protein
MIDRFFRRLTVGRRVLGVALGLIVLLALTLPVILADHSALVGRLRQATDVEGRADRQLLQAAVSIESSRVDLMRYVQDLLPSSQWAQADVSQASDLLGAVQGNIASEDQRKGVASVLGTLNAYQTLIRNIEAARRRGDEPETTQLVAQAYRTGSEIGLQIEKIVNDSEASVNQANETAYAEADARLRILVIGYVVVLAFTLGTALALVRSITRPVAELRRGAEAFSQGRLTTTIFVAGTDELSVLGRTFNQMAEQLARSYAELEQRVADRTAELERRSSYLQAASDVGRAAASILNADQLMSETTEVIRQRFALYYVGLFLTDESGEWAILKMGTGEAGRSMLARGHKLRIGGGSMIGWVIANGQARLALEADRDAERLATAELPDTRSEAALPLHARGRVIGALTVQSSQPGAFDEAALAVLQTMADQVAVALENARMFAESQVALEAAHRAYSQLSREAWADLLRTRREPDYVADAQGVHPAQGEWQPAMIEATRTGQTVHQDGNTLAIPIKIRDSVAGVVRLKSSKSSAWTPDEIALMETLTEQLSTALESARLYQDTQSRAAQERLISEVTSRIRESLDIETVLKTTASEMRQALDLDKLVIRLATPEADGASKPARERT